MKLIVLLLATFALPLPLFSQGQVFFANTSSTLFTTNYGGQVGLMSGFNAYRIGLYTAPDGTVDPFLFTLVAIATNSSIFPGRFFYSNNDPVTLQANNGTPIAYQVRAWLISNPFVSGTSAIGRVVPGVGGVPPPNLFSPLAGFPEFPGQLTAGLVIGVPEPGIWTLLALGAAFFGVLSKNGLKLFRGNTRSSASVPLPAAQPVPI